MQTKEEEEAAIKASREKANLESGKDVEATGVTPNGNGLGEKKVVDDDDDEDEEIRDEVDARREGGGGGGIRWCSG